MLSVAKFSLRVLKNVNIIFNPDASNFGRNWKMFPMKNYSNSLIYKSLQQDKPLMIARLGANELSSMTNYLGVKHPNKFKSIKGYINDTTPQWWWNKSIMNQMRDIAGFFPADPYNIEKFCEIMFANLSQVDILGSWLKEETFFKDELMGAKKVMLEDLEPFFSDTPWTWALEGKKVLVVHPFADQIESQYINRDKLFDNNLLPKFDLITMKSVQSLAREKTIYGNWFEALEAMKNQIAAIDFDICILGCGAYGFPLAAFIKGMGKKSIHLGGATQLLFGIKGARWENYIVYPYTNLYNDYWVRPLEKNKPKNSSLVEGAAYW